jgi:uncharacterized protein YajQ (UPF0234 family)
MAKTESFDITTGCDLQEVDNAVNQARKKLVGRFDFKGVLADIDFDRTAATISIHTTDEFKLDAIWGALVGRFVSREVPIENMKRGDVEHAGGSTVRQVVTLVQGIDAETARRVTKFIRDQKLKRVQSQIQGDAVRVSAPNRDDLQTVIRAVRAEEWGIELIFGNYR